MQSTRRLSPLQENQINRDFAGCRIIEPAAPLPTKLKQAAEHVAGTLVSPYSTFAGTALPKSSKRFSAAVATNREG